MFSLGKRSVPAIRFINSSKLMSLYPMVECLFLLVSLLFLPLSSSPCVLDSSITASSNATNEGNPLSVSLELLEPRLERILLGWLLMDSLWLIRACSLLLIVDLVAVYGWYSFVGVADYPDLLFVKTHLFLSDLAFESWEALLVSDDKLDLSLLASASTFKFLALELEMNSLTNQVILSLNSE